MPTAGEADFCLLFGGLQKVRRPAGRACALKRYGAQAQPAGFESALFQKSRSTPRVSPPNDDLLSLLAQGVLWQ
jgi:hypothetical protein